MGRPTTWCRSPDPGTRRSRCAPPACRWRRPMSPASATASTTQEFLSAPCSCSGRLPICHKAAGAGSRPRPLSPPMSLRGAKRRSNPGRTPARTVPKLLRTRLLRRFAPLNDMERTLAHGVQQTMPAYQYVYTMKECPKSVPGGRDVFKGSTLAFLPGVKIGVLGVNGAGKSTLLKIMAGLDTEFGGEAWAAEGV